jgi:hypothetical protein
MTVEGVELANKHVDSLLAGATERGQYLTMGLRRSNLPWMMHPKGFEVTNTLVSMADGRTLFVSTLATLR